MDPLDRNFEDPSRKSEPLSERDAYFQSLRSWIADAQMVQHFSSCLPFYFMQMQGFPNINGATNPLLNNNFPQPVPQPANDGRNNLFNRRRFNEGNPNAADQIARYGGYEYVVPPLYKRLIAEVIDFLLLFFIKLMLTFIAVDYFGIIDLEKFDLDLLAKNFSEEDYQTALEMTQEILMVEFGYRMLVCFYEAWCISYGLFGGRQSGATPGKTLLGLKVIQASACVAVPNRPQETVLVYPATPVSFGIALLRSILKNLLISLLFPVCLVLFVFVHNRTCYDCICNVIVVEDNMYPQRRNQP